MRIDPPHANGVARDLADREALTRAILDAEPSRTLSPPSAGPRVGAREATVSTGVVRGLVEAVEQAGVTRVDLLRAAELDAARLETPEARMTYGDVGRLCELAIDLTGDPAFGLHWAERLSERAFVPISHLVAHASTLRQGLELLAQFFGLLSDAPAYEVFELEGAVALRVVPYAGWTPRVQAFSSEMTIAGFFRLVRSLDAHVEPALVSFSHPAPAHRAEYDRLFEGSARFEQPFTGLAFDHALLDASPPQKDDAVREALEGLAEQRLARIAQRAPYALRVRDLLVRDGSPRRQDMAAVARSLGISERSLRRRLADEGKSYGEIVDEALAIVAKQLLRDHRLTIQEVGYEMGFSDASAFHRAFKRWTGTTPNAFREGAGG